MNYFDVFVIKGFTVQEIVTLSVDKKSKNLNIYM